MSAAKGFLRAALQVSGETPDRVTTDGHDSYRRAIREELGVHVKHRTNRYLNNWIKQDHRGMKQRYGPMRAFGSFESAGRFCRAFDELRSFYRVPGVRGTRMSSAARRRHHQQRTATLGDLLVAH